MTSVAWRMSAPSLAAAPAYAALRRWLFTRQTSGINSAPWMCGLSCGSSSRAASASSHCARSPRPSPSETARRIAAASLCVSARSSLPHWTSSMSTPDASSSSGASA